MPKSNIVRLQHMFDSARKAIDFCKGHTREDLDSEDLLGLAVVRLIEVVGEAASQVTPDFQDRHSQLPGSNIIGARHRLIHGYDEVDMDIVWSIIQEDLPKIAQQLEEIIKKESEKE